MADVVELLFRARDEATGVIDGLSRHVEGLRGHLESVGHLVVAGLGFEAINAAVGGVDSFVHGLIDANSEAQQLHQTLVSVYGSVQEANQAFAWIRQNEQVVPFDLASIQQASVLVATYGGDITRVMPMLESLASVHHQTLGTAAQAWQDLLEAGLPRMMMRDFGITKEMLLQTGLVAMDAKRHLTGDVEGALEKLVAQRYPNALALQMNTLGGALSSLHTQFTLFEQTAGAQMFAQLQQHITDFVHYLQTHQADVRAFGTTMGSVFGALSSATFGGIQWLITSLPPAITAIRVLWGDIAPAVSAAFQTVESIISAFVGWFRTSAVPVIQTAIGLMDQWWQQHGAAVLSATNNIINTVRNFAGMVMSGLRDTWNIIAADVRLLWDSLANVFTLGGDVITGNWSKFGADFIRAVRQLAGDSVQAFGALFVGVVDLTTRLSFSLAEALVPVAQDFVAPLSWIAEQFRALFKDLGGLVGAFAGAIVTTLTSIEGSFARFFNHLIDAYNAVADKLHVAKISDMVDPTALPKPVLPVYGPQQPFIGPIMPGYTPPKQPMGPPAPPLSPGEQASKSITDWFNQHAPGLNKGETFNPPMSQKNLEDARTSIITPFDNYIRDTANSIQNMFDPSSAHVTKANKDAQKLGAEVIDNLFSGIKAHFGTQSSKLGPLFTPTGNAGSGGLPTGGLPVPTYGAEDGTGTTPATTAGGLGTAAQYLFAGTQSLGQLVATFGSTVVGASHSGAGAGTADLVTHQQRSNTLLQQVADHGAAQLTQATTMEYLARQGNALLQSVGTTLAAVQVGLRALPGHDPLLSAGAKRLAVS